MSAADHLGRYAEGWCNGDADTILEAAMDEYTFDDPNAGVITRQQFAGYLADLKEAVRGRCGGTLPEPFMALSDVVTQDDGGILTAWCWWSIPGTDVKGSGLIKATAQGVRSEVITYYAKPAG